MLIDVHAHLSGEEYNEQGGVEGLLLRMKEHGVARVIASGYDIDTSIVSMRIAEQHDEAYQVIRAQSLPNR